MSTNLNWDEFRLVKAIGDSHSLVGAAELLDLNHSTVFRRLAALEAAVGVRLFERARSGYQPTAAGEEMMALATTMSDSIAEFERRVAGRDVKPAGDLRITTLEIFALDVLPPILTRFRSANPGIHLEVIVAPQELNLARREADVALRATNGPTESLVGRRLCAMRWAIYCAPEIAQDYGDDLLDSAPWIAFGDESPSTRGRRWFEMNVDPRRQVFRANTLLGVAELAARGAGASVLPCFIGERAGGLVRVGEIQPDLDVELWLLTHPDLRHSPRVRAFMQFVGDELGQLRARFEGDLGAA